MKIYSLRWLIFQKVILDYLFDLWIDSLGNSRNTKHNSPRVKVKTSSGNYVPISISRTPEVLAKVSSKDLRDANRMLGFISDAYDILIDHWNQKITDYTALSKLIKLANKS